MTIRQLLAVLIRADDLDCEIGIETSDGVDLGPVQREGSTSVLVLTLPSRDVAALVTEHQIQSGD